MTIHPDFLCEDDEARLVAYFDKELAKLRQKKQGGRNRILRYGWDYDNPNKWLKDFPPRIGFPEPPVTESAACGYSVQISYLECDSVTINEYITGQSIAPHIDSKAFGDVAILSLLADAEMQFVSPPGEIKHFILQRRSLAIMWGELRHKWSHETLPLVADRRISIVYRTKL